MSSDLLAGVYRNADEIGTIVKTETGTAFHFAADYQQSSIPGGGVSFTMPYRKDPQVFAGRAIHSFFTNMLPEGRRLTALKERNKISFDDDLSLLLASGPDTVGDISIVRPGGDPFAPQAIVDVLNLENADFRVAAEQSIGGKVTEPSVPGVMDKVSAGMISLPIRSRRKREYYILKLNPPDKPTLIENEHACMTFARACGLTVAETRLVVDKRGVPGLLVRRFDRVAAKPHPIKLHVEDACQFCSRYPADKYDLTMSEIATGLMQFSSAPKVELLRLLELYVFSYLVCNGDMHAKNISLLTSADGVTRLSPAYDLVCTLVYQDDKMALKLDGRDDNFNGRDIVQFGLRFGIPEAATRDMILRLVSALGKYKSQFDALPFTAKEKLHFEQVHAQRLQRVVQFQS
ncbi:MAG: HipA domain-containing protein [Fimbriimonadales bacterium]